MLNGNWTPIYAGSISENLERETLNGERAMEKGL